MHTTSWCELETNDRFGTKEKAQAIKDTITQLIARNEPCNMMALYGEWGCGKTSVLKWLENQYNVEDSKTLVLFFEAWQFERDENLALSLLDFLTEEVDYREKIKLLQTGYSLLKNTARSLKLGPVDGSKLIDGVEADFQPRQSYYRQLKQLKAEFCELENYILTSKNVDNILVMIDDLDRCEPEKIIDLIAAIKLFFTYTDNTMYLCAIDEEAVTEALNVKYSSDYFSSHYLEKLFDLTFHMPYKFDIEEFLYHHFDKIGEEAPFLSSMLERIKFTNPRRVIHIFNKLKKIIPSSNGRLNKWVFALYVYWLIMLEYYPSTYDEIVNMQTKKTRTFEKGAFMEFKEATDHQIQSIFDEFMSISAWEMARRQGNQHMRIPISHTLYFLPYPSQVFDKNDSYSQFLSRYDNSDCSVPYLFIWFMLDSWNEAYHDETQANYTYKRQDSYIELREEIELKH